MAYLIYEKLASWRNLTTPTLSNCWGFVPLGNQCVSSWSIWGSAISMSFSDLAQPAITGRLIPFLLTGMCGEMFG